MVVRKFCHDDENLASFIFYRIASKHPDKLLPYLMEGLKPGSYAWECCADEYDDMPRVKAWIDTNITQAIHGPGKGGKGLTPARALIAQALRDMADGIEGGARG
jgi:hypothetical protein